MKDKNINIYAKLSSENNNAIFSGITFSDFIECAPIHIENILLLKSGYWGDKQCHNFEILEGRHNIAKLRSENIYQYGDFCFVDYASPTSVLQLTDDEIAELLYLAHLYKPLRSPFYETLQNYYTYLSHDDGWYSKLYCKDQHVLSSILINKILKEIKINSNYKMSSLPDALMEKIMKLFKRGVLIQLNILKNNKAKDINIMTVKLYEVGEYSNMDILFNDIDSIKFKLSYEFQL